MLTVVNPERDHDTYFKKNVSIVGGITSERDEPVTIDICCIATNEL